MNTFGTNTIQVRRVRFEWMLRALVSLLLLLIACAPAPITITDPTSAPQSIGTPTKQAAGPSSAPAGWDALVAAAEKEGKVTIYGTYREGEKSALTTAFMKDYPKIQIEFFSLGGPESGARILAEQKACLFNNDLIIGGTSTSTQTLLPGGALDPIKPLLILPEVLDPSAWYGSRLYFADPEGKYTFVFQGNGNNGSSMVVNKKLVNANEFKSFKDFLDPKWKGKIVAWDPRKSGVGSEGILFLYSIPELGPQYIRDLLTKTDITLSNDNRQNLDWIAQGRYSVGIWISDVEAAQAQGLPIDNIPVLKEGGNISAGGGNVSLLKNAPHPKATHVYVNWLLSKKGQMAWQELGQGNSLRIDIPKEVPTAAGNALVPGIKYLITALPEYNDPKVRDDVRKIVNESLAGR